MDIETAFQRLVALGFGPAVFTEARETYNRHMHKDTEDLEELVTTLERLING